MSVTPSRTAIAHVCKIRYESEGEIYVGGSPNIQTDLSSAGDMMSRYGALLMIVSADSLLFTGCSHC